MRILLIEDDVDFAYTLKEKLSKRYIVDLSFDGGDGVFKAQTNDYVLIIIDIMLPDTDGIEVCRKLRQAGVQAPMLMLTARFELEYKVSSLDKGADDYITKPFKLAELEARIRALLRRNPEISHQNKLVFGDLVLDVGERSLVVSGKPVPLRKKELNILEIFMRYPNRVLSSEFFLENVWDCGLDVSSNTVRVHINSLRRKMREFLKEDVIKTVYGLGYKFEV